MQLKAKRPKSLRTIQERIESARKKRYEPPKNNQKVSMWHAFARGLFCFIKVVFLCVFLKNYMKNMLVSAKLIERMLAQNNLDQIALGRKLIY